MKKELSKPLIIWVAHEGNISGANISMLEYMDVLFSDYSFHVILPHKGSMCKELEIRKILYTIIPQYGWAITSRKSIVNEIRFYIRSYIALRACQNLFKSLSPLFVFTNTSVSFIGAKAAFLEGIKHIWWIHELGEEHFGFTLGNGNKHYAYKKIGEWSNSIICNSRAVAEKYINLLPTANIQVIYQPVSLKFKSEKVEKKGKFLVFGQISYAKGMLDIIEAVTQNKLNNRKLEKVYFIGPCESESFYQLLLKKIIESNLQEWIKIERGYFEKIQVFPFFEVLIVASKHEAFGRVIIEAGKAGLHVVVKNSGGAPELVNKTNGLIYDTTEDLAKILSGDLSLPKGILTQNYDENAELMKLKNILSEIA